MKAFKSGILALSLLAAAGSAPAQPVPADLAVEASNARLQVAINNRVDTSDLKALYTTDAVIIPPSGEIYSDTADYSTFLADYMRNRMGNFQVETINLRTVGDVTYQSAVWMATLKRDNGKDSEISGEMTNVLQRQADGNWKIRFQNWN